VKTTIIDRLSREDYFQGEFGLDIWHEYEARDVDAVSGPDAILDFPEVGVSFSLAEIYQDID
jgi:hypothetical protein